MAECDETIDRIQRDEAGRDPLGETKHYASRELTRRSEQ